MNKRKRITGIKCLLLPALLLLVFLGTFTAVSASEESKEKLNAFIQNLQENLEPSVSDPYSLLLIGADRRDESWNGNSDVMILVTVSEESRTICLTSFLRDLYSDIPGLGVSKLNAACAYGGPDLCVETIENNYDVTIDNRAMVDFTAMRQIVDALGGVDVELTESEVTIANQIVRSMCAADGVDPEPHLLSGSGFQHLDGYQALGYTRNRTSGSTSDFGRTQRQRTVLNAIFQKMKNESLPVLAQAVTDVLPYVDHDLSELTIFTLVSKLGTWITYDIREQHVPYDGEYYIENEILIPYDMDATIQKIQDTIRNR